MRFALPLIALLAACRIPAVPPPPLPVPAPPVTSTADPAPRPVPGEEAAFVRIDLPGCTDESLAAFRKRVDALGQAMRRPPVTPASVAEIRALWEEPCFAHVARFMRPPAATEDLHELWGWGIHGVLGTMAGGLLVREGRRYFVIPPESNAPVSASELSLVSRWLCPPGETSCGHAQSFVKRAEDAFTAAEDSAHAFRGPLVSGGGPLPNVHLEERLGCEPRYPKDEATASRGLTVFEDFIQCSFVVAPTSWRYPGHQAFRSIDRGWLVLRGRRGHYQFSDEIRAYDLATGSAYIATSSSALVLAPDVDHRATDAQRKPEAFAGSVSRDQLRELAFVLATGSVLRARRDQTTIINVPRDLPIELSGPKTGRSTLDIPINQWYSSAHTKIAWEIWDGATRFEHGALLWPSSWRPEEDHADNLLRVLEAGLDRGCPPATLPPGLARGHVAAVSPIDASPASQGKAYDGLAALLENGHFCP